jgi:hypothetical protein
LVLISGSIRYLVEPVVADLGFHHLLCTDLEIGPDGLLTGKAKGPLCLDSTKRLLALKLAKEAQIDLASSYRKKPKTQDGRKLRRYRRRWKIERLFAWLHNFKRLPIRYEYHADNFLSMVQLGCAIILLRLFCEGFYIISIGYIMNELIIGDNNNETFS